MIAHLLHFLHFPALGLAYLLFLAAAIVGLLFILQEHRIKTRNALAVTSKLPSLELMENLIFRMIGMAFPLLTLGMLLGAHWALHARGRFWGWDPTESFSLDTWVVYAGYLILRGGLGWRGRKATYLSLAGFSLVLVSLVALFFFSPLHTLGRKV